MAPIMPRDALATAAPPSAIVRHGKPIAVAVRGPMQREAARGRDPFELGRGQCVVLLRAGVARARDGAPDEDEAGTMREPVLRIGDQRVLAGAARADDGDERADRKS